MPHFRSLVKNVHKIQINILNLKLYMNYVLNTFLRTRKVFNQEKRYILNSNTSQRKIIQVEK